MLVKIGKWLFRCINLCLFKRANKVVIHMLPDFDDMTKALLLNMPAGYKVVVLTHNTNSSPKWLYDNSDITTNVIKKLSLQGLWHYFTAKYVFFSHGCFSSVMPVKGQISVNVWHGMPIKKVGDYLSSTHVMPMATYHVVTSEFYKEIFTKAFRCNEESILISGSPRNDILLSTQHPEKKAFLLYGNKKMLVWLPTYRQSTFGDIRLDGVQSDNIYGLNDINEVELNDQLKLSNTVLYVKPHPMALLNGIPENVFSNIKLINEGWLLNKELTLYELLSYSDGLISDVSSVMVDYQLTEKPIICCFPDFKDYSDSRGLLPNIELQDLYSVQTTNFAELKLAISNFNNLKVNSIKEKYHLKKLNFTPALFKFVLKDHD